ncbi:MAG: DUF2188 domain-containing protein [Spirochaetaceae bacterium]
MSKGEDRTIFQRNDGCWVNQRNGNQKATSIHSNQKDAYDAARTNHQNKKGGEISIKRGDNGRIRAKHTIKPANDPRNIPG